MFLFSQSGDKLPAVDLFEGAPDKKVNTGAEISKGKTVIFGVPGAFTPTCSNVQFILQLQEEN